MLVFDLLGPLLTYSILRSHGVGVIQDRRLDAIGLRSLLFHVVAAALIACMVVYARRAQRPQPRG